MLPPGVVHVPHGGFAERFHFGALRGVCRKLDAYPFVMIKGAISVLSLPASPSCRCRSDHDRFPDGKHPVLSLRTQTAAVAGALMAGLGCLSQ